MQKITKPSLIQTISVDQLARFFVYVTAAALPFSTVVVNLSLMGLLVCALLSQTFWARLADLIRTPVVLVSLIAFSSLIVGTMWADVPVADSGYWISKYKKFLFIPLAMPFFVERKNKEYLLWVLFWSLSFSVVFATIQHYAIVYALFEGEAGGGAARITLSVLHDFLFVLAILLARQVSNKRNAFLLYCIAAASVAEIFLVLAGRTGQVIFVALLCAGAWILLLDARYTVRTKLKFFSVGIVLMVLGASLVAQNPNSRLRNSVEKVLQHKDEALKPGSEAVSVDIRLIFYKTTVSLIAERPLLGWGTGGHVPAIARVSQQGTTPDSQIAFTQPHNEYLLWAVQLGAIGLSVFIAWLAVAWMSTRHMADELTKYALRGWWIIFALGCLMNSFLLDFSEGYLTMLLFGCLTPIAKQKISEN